MICTLYLDYYYYEYRSILASSLRPGPQIHPQQQAHSLIHLRLSPASHLDKSLRILLNLSEDKKVPTMLSRIQFVLLPEEVYLDSDNHNEQKEEGNSVIKN